MIVFIGIDNWVIQIIGFYKFHPKIIIEASKKYANMDSRIYKRVKNHKYRHLVGYLTGSLFLVNHDDSAFKKTCIVLMHCSDISINIIKKCIVSK